MTKAKTPNLMVYAVRDGYLFLAAEELGRKNGRIMVKDAAYISRPTNELGFLFTPLKWVDRPMLYESALLLDDAMPKDMVPYFLKHQEKMAEVRKARPS